MQSHGPKRFYTPLSLEFWFEKLAEEWAGVFSPAQLEEGRRIYRDGEVRELELSDRDAIVHRRIEKKDEYAVIEHLACFAGQFMGKAAEINAIRRVCKVERVSPARHHQAVGPKPQ